MNSPMLPYMAARPRIDLAAAVPLEAPLVVFVEPTNVCNFHCTFCPEGFTDYPQRAGYYGHMKRELWEKILCSLKQWPRLKVIRFYFEGEPLLNPDLARMIAESHDIAERSVVTTNGSLLAKRAHELINADLNYLKVSIYGFDPGEYQDFTQQRAFDALSIYKNLQVLRVARGTRARPWIYVELVKPKPSRIDAGLFRTMFTQVADEVGILDEMHNWTGNAADLVTIGTAPADARQVCPSPFYQLVIRADGALTVCCVDWRAELKIGDANHQSLQEIWQGNPLRNIRNAHLAGDRNRLFTCRECTAIRKHPDNLEVLLGRTL